MICYDHAVLHAPARYTEQDLQDVGAANLGEGCGNPISFAPISEGDTVVDLGSGAGIDCILAGQYPLMCMAPNCHLRVKHTAIDPHPPKLLDCIPTNEQDHWRSQRGGSGQRGRSLAWT